MILLLGLDPSELRRLLILRIKLTLLLSKRTKRRNKKRRKGKVPLPMTHLLKGEGRRLNTMTTILFILIMEMLIFMPKSMLVKDPEQVKMKMDISMMMTTITTMMMTISTIDCCQNKKRQNSKTS